MPEKAPPKPRNVAAKALAAAANRPRVMAPKKGKGAYSRKKIDAAGRNPLAPAD